MLLRKPTLRSPLAYPAGVAPGFNPNHVAGTSVLASCVATAAQGLNLLNGQPGTLAGGGGMLGGIDGSIGPFEKPGSTTTNKFTSPAGVHLPITVAGIFTLTSLAAVQNILSTTGWRFGLSSSTQLQLVSNGVSSFTWAPPGLAANTPYLWIASASSSKSAQILVNLQTGQVVTTTGGGSGAPASDGNFGFPGSDNLGQNGNLKLAAGMMANAFLPLQAQLQWAQDPWAFWYPRNIDLTQIMSPAVAAGGSFLAAWAQNSNLPVLGTGTY